MSTLLLLGLCAIFALSGSDGSPALELPLRSVYNATEFFVNGHRPKYTLKNAAVDVSYHVEHAEDPIVNLDALQELQALSCGPSHLELTFNTAVAAEAFLVRIAPPHHQALLVASAYRWGCAGGVLLRRMAAASAAAVGSTTLSVETTSAGYHDVFRHADIRVKHPIGAGGGDGGGQQDGNTGGGGSGGEGKKTREAARRAGRPAGRMVVDEDRLMSRSHRSAPATGSLRWFLGDFFTAVYHAAVHIVESATRIVKTVVTVIKVLDGSSRNIEGHTNLLDPIHLTLNGTFDDVGAYDFKLDASLTAKWWLKVSHHSMQDAGALCIGQLDAVTHLNIYAHRAAYSRNGTRDIMEWTSNPHVINIGGIPFLIQLSTPITMSWGVKLEVNASFSVVAGVHGNMTFGLVFKDGKAEYVRNTSGLITHGDPPSGSLDAQMGLLVQPHFALALKVDYIVQASMTISPGVEATIDVALNPTFQDSNHCPRFYPDDSLKPDLHIMLAVNVVLASTLSAEFNNPISGPVTLATRTYKFAKLPHWTWCYQLPNRAQRPVRAKAAQFIGATWAGYPRLICYPRDFDPEGFSNHAAMQIVQSESSELEVVFSFSGNLRNYQCACFCTAHARFTTAEQSGTLTLTPKMNSSGPVDFFHSCACTDGDCDIAVQEHAIRQLYPGSWDTFVLTEGCYEWTLQRDPDAPRPPQTTCGQPCDYSSDCAYPCQTCGSAHSGWRCM